MKTFSEILVCDCSSVEHQLVFSTIEGDSDVYVSIHLVRPPFFQRLWGGIKYIFGHRSKYGDFDEVILTKEHVEKLEKVVKWLKTDHNPIK